MTELQSRYFIKKIDDILLLKCLLMCNTYLAVFALYNTKAIKKGLQTVSLSTIRRACNKNGFVQRVDVKPFNSDSRFGFRILNGFESFEKKEIGFEDKLLIKYYLSKGKKCCCNAFKYFNAKCDFVYDSLFTGFQLDHIDGNHFHNVLSNLNLLCSNHHSIKTDRFEDYRHKKVAND